MIKNKYEKYVLESKPHLIDTGIQYCTKLPRCMHRHDDRIEILFIKKGQGIHEIDGKSYATQPGDILIFDVNVLHDEKANQNTELELLFCSISNIKIKGFIANKILADNMCPVIHNSYYADDIKNILKTIYKVKQKQEDFAEELLEYLLSSLILIICKASIENTEILTKRVFEIGNSIKDYIDKHYLEEIDIPKIAKVMKIGQSYISHSFKKATGYSVMQYIIRRRIGEAQSWLLMSDLSVTEIAMKVGYNSVSNFHNTFRKIVGMSPKKYRKYWD